MLDLLSAAAEYGGYISLIKIIGYLILFFAWLSLRDNYIGNLSDGAVYLLMADHHRDFRFFISPSGAGYFCKMEHTSPYIIS